MKRRAAGASVRPAGTPPVATATPTDGLKRVAIEAVTPEIDSGRFPAKRVVGETVVVEADIFTDGHDALAAVVRYRHKAATGWRETPMAPLVNDRDGGDEAWVHAHLHRVEGDNGNANYWYRRAGRSPSSAALETERDAIIQALLPETGDR